MSRLREEVRGLRGGGDRGGWEALTEDCISQETQQNKNTTYCMSPLAGKCSASLGRLLREVIEK